jgi:hypothetical protein
MNTLTFLCTRRNRRWQLLPGVLGWLLIGASSAVGETKQAPDWVCVNKKADWQARDSQGELVFDGHLWILGGWYTPQTPNPRDVWKSPDGKRWIRTAEVAPWEHSDLSAAMVFKDRMWFMGGRKLPGAENSNKVWSSTDGAEWSLETDNAGWRPRVAPMFAVFKDRMWILGGTENFYDHSDKMVKNDVWSSADGKAWRLAAANAPWPKRAHGQAVVFDNKIWIMGGGLWSPQHVPFNDIWCSEDGVNWTQVTSAAPWKPRLWFSTVVYRNRMWVLGGWSKEHDNFGDVWYSRDGKHWTEVKSDVIWKSRHEHSAVVFKDKIWVAGGHARPLNSEVWTLDIPADWFKDE